MEFLFRGATFLRSKTFLIFYFFFQISDKETQRNSRQKLRMAEEISVNLPSIEPMEEVEDPCT